MQDIIELTPELLLEQSQEMQSLCAAYENLFANISSDLTGINESWSDLLANNFSGKIGSAQKTFSGTLTMLGNVANGTRNVAETLQGTDTEWASKISGALNAVVSSSSAGAETAQSVSQTSPVNVAGYCEKVTHTEYAKLCQLWQEADRACDKSADTTLAGTYAALLRNNLPENDPLHNISEEQIQITRSSSGLAAAVIGNGDQALVIFAGTDFSKANDILADAALVAGIESDQEKEAKALVESLSKEYSDIVVTGHSLGGYLATAATLDNDAVSECVAFDPPGRKDRDENFLFNNKQYSKVTTYKAVGSPVSSYVADNRGIGKVVPVFVSMENNPGNHGIKQIYDALDDGEGKIRETWDNAQKFRKKGVCVMSDLFALTPEVLLEQSQEMQSLCAAYETLFGNIMSDLSGINESWSDLLSNNFSGKIGSAQKTFSGALAMLRNSASGTRAVAEAAREMDELWASKIGGTTGGTGGSSTQTLLSALGMDADQRTAYLGEVKDLKDALKKLEEKYGDNVPPSVQEWIDLLWGKADKAYFDKSFGKAGDIAEVFEKLADEDYQGAFKTGGKTILKEVFGEAVKGTAGEAVTMFGYKYDPTTKYYINMGLGIGEGLGEFVQEPSLENLTEIAWNASAKAVLETAGSSIETMTRLIPGISEYYYDEHGAEDIGGAAGVALGDLYAMFTPDEGIKEYASNYYKDGMWEGLWGGFEDIGNFVEESGGVGEAAKRFFDTAAKDGQETLDHMVDNAKHLWNGVQSLFTGEVISTSKPVGGSGGGGGASFDQSGGGGAAF